MPKDKTVYTTISLSRETKKELEELLYSLGKKKSYDDLINELIILKKEADAQCKT